MKLLYHVTFIAENGKDKNTKEILHQFVKDSMMGPGESDLWKGVMEIPTNFKIPITNLGGNCKIIQIDYELKLTVRHSGMATPLKVRLPITIGTIPFCLNT